MQCERWGACFAHLGPFTAARQPYATPPPAHTHTITHITHQHTQAVECRFAEDAYVKLQQGFACAESEGAKGRLAAVKEEIEKAEAEKSGGGTFNSSAMLLLLRLSPDELGVRCASVSDARLLLPAS